MSLLKDDEYRTHLISFISNLDKPNSNIKTICQLKESIINFNDQKTNINALVNNGFIRISGQNFQNEILFKKEDGDDFGIWTFWNQKSYLAGYMKTIELKKIINNIDDNINYVFMNKDNKRVSNSEKKKIFYTRYRQSLFRNVNHEKKWCKYTFEKISKFNKYYDIIKELDINKKLQEKLHEEYSYVEFSCKKYNIDFDIENYILTKIKL